MEDNKKNLYRDSLYKEVWQTPITKLATKYGISDVGLKKICKNLNVPTPPRGYWAKVHNNIRIDKTPLPKLKIGQPQSYTMKKYDTPISQPMRNGSNLSFEAHQLISQLNSNKPYKVPAKLVSPHPLVAETHEVLLKAETNKYGILVGNWKKKYLDIRVSPGMLKRALRIFDSIIKFLESEDIKVLVEKNDYERNTHIKIFNEKINFFLREPSRQRNHKLSQKEEQELNRWPHSYFQKYDYNPSGKLSLEIDTYGGAGIKKRWTDGKRNRVEDKILDFTINLIKIADINRTERIQREEERKRLKEEQQHFAELERLKKIEEQRLRELENQADLWDQSKRLRAYIQAVEDASIGREFTEKSKTNFIKWIKWAKAHASRLDPLSEGLPFEYE